MPDKNFVSASSVLYDGVYVPGGGKSINALTHQGYVIDFINEAYKHCKPIAASGEAVALLQQTGIDAKLATAKDVISDLGVVTSQAAPTSQFTQTFISAIALHRHWTREKTETIPPSLTHLYFLWAQRVRGKSKCEFHKTTMQVKQMSIKEDPIKLHKQAIALMENGKCDEARDLFVKVAELYYKGQNYFGPSEMNYKAAE